MEPVTQFDFSDLALMAAILSPLVWKLVDFVKQVLASDRNAVVTMLVVWIASTALAFLLRETDFASRVGVGPHSLEHLNWASVVFIGFSLGALTSVGYDFKKALDNSDTAAVPAILPEQTKVVDTTTGGTTDVAGAITDVNYEGEHSR